MTTSNVDYFICRSGITYSLCDISYIGFTHDGGMTIILNLRYFEPLEIDPGNVRLQWEEFMSHWFEFCERGKRLCKAVYKGKCRGIEPVFVLKDEDPIDPNTLQNLDKADVKFTIEVTPRVPVVKFW